MRDGCFFKGSHLKLNEILELADKYVEFLLISILNNYSNLTLKFIKIQRQRQSKAPNFFSLET